MIPCSRFGPFQIFDTIRSIKCEAAVQKLFAKVVAVEASFEAPDIVDEIDRIKLCNEVQVRIVVGVIRNCWN